MSVYLITWIPNLKGRLCFSADGANANIERAILKASWNNHALVGNTNAFRTFSSYERYLDDRELPDLLSINHYLSKKLYQIMAAFKAASPTIQYTYYAKAKHPKDIENLKNIKNDNNGDCDWHEFGVCAESPYCLEIEILYFTPLSKDNLFDSIITLPQYFNNPSNNSDQLWDNLVNEAKYIAKQGNHLRKNSFFSAKAVLFPNGLLFIPTDKFIQLATDIPLISNSQSNHANITAQLFEVYSFLRDSWHCHKFHRNDDDTQFSFSKADLTNINNYNIFKEQVAYNLSEVNSFFSKHLITILRPEKNLITDENINFLADVKGQIEYQTTFENIIRKLFHNSAEPIIASHGFIDVMEKKVVESNNLKKDFWGSAWVILGIIFAGFALISTDTLFQLDDFISSIVFINEYPFLDFCSKSNEKSDSLNCSSLIGVSNFIINGINNKKFNAFDLILILLMASGTFIYLVNRFKTLNKAYSLLLYTDDIENRTYRVFRSLKTRTFLPIPFSFFFKVRNWGISDVLVYVWNRINFHCKRNNISRLQKAFNSIIFLIISLLATAPSLLIWSIFNIIYIIVYFFCLLLPFPAYTAANIQSFIVYLPLCIAKFCDMKCLKYIPDCGDKL